MMPVVLASMLAAALAVDRAPQIVTDTDHTQALQHYKEGERAYHAEHYEEAEREFEAAIKLDPLLEIAHYALGQVYMATKRYRPAVAAFIACRDAFRRGVAEALQDEVANQQRLDDRIRALEDTKQGYESGIARTASTIATVQRLDMQIAQLKNLRRRNRDRPPEVPAWISLALGSAYFRSNAMADAEREYREAIRVDPKLGEAHNNLAVTLMLTGRLDEAGQEIKAAEKAGFRVNPQFKEDLKQRRKGIQN